MKFSGVPLLKLLVDSAGQPKWDDSAQFVSFGARSDHNHSTSLPLSEVLKLQPLIALKHDGKDLPTEHGGPVRVVVPGKYFYKSVKWLERIELLAQDQLGYWESDAGYHNQADPWKEQRYIAATLSKQETKKLIDSRDFHGRDLLSLDVEGRQLAGLNAEGALMRNANLKGADLSEANFSTANLSNAQLDRANLQNSNFRNADLEGASFSGANLCGADLRGASLFGTSFCEITDSGIENPAQLDDSTKFSDESLEALTQQQRDSIRAFLDQ